MPMLKSMAPAGVEGFHVVYCTEGLALEPTRNGGQHTAAPIGLHGESLVLAMCGAPALSLKCMLLWLPTRSLNPSLTCTYSKSKVYLYIKENFGT